jgi:hypothetical protein
MQFRGKSSGERSRWPRRNVEDDGRRSWVKQPLDKVHELVRILKACTRIEASDLEELPVALDAPIYPPRPHVLALSPASDLHSGQCQSFLRSRAILACVVAGSSSYPNGSTNAGWGQAPAGRPGAAQRGRERRLLDSFRARQGTSTTSRPTLLGFPASSANGDGQDA